MIDKDKCEKMSECVIYDSPEERRIKTEMLRNLYLEYLEKQKRERNRQA
ncbi:MAG: hypothetical protein ACLTLL_01775 [Acutalibacteraceae bacterium]|jgi:hypothetical protein